MSRERKRMGPDERAAAARRWAELGALLLGDIADGIVTPGELEEAGREAIDLIGAIVRDRKDADDVPDAAERR